MSSVEKSLETQLKNIQTRTGRSLEQIYSLVRGSGRARHGEIRDFLKEELSLGFGDANTLAHLYLKSGGVTGAPAAEPSVNAAVDQLYTGPKASLLPIHHRVMAAISTFGPFETVPKKAYLSLRRKKQFAMVGPATKTRADIGISLEGVPATARLAAIFGDASLAAVRSGDASAIAAAAARQAPRCRTAGLPRTAECGRCFRRPEW